MQPLPKQLVVSFVLSWFYWIIIYYVMDLLFFHRHHSLRYQLANGVWMAFLWTLIFNWKRLTGSNPKSIK